jgi:hypothetical protein
MRKLKLPGRSKEMPRLDDTDFRLVRELGIQEIREQARRLVRRKLKQRPENDGKQTPRRGNPVYKAMHACNCASRKELKRSHRIPADRDLSKDEVEEITDLLTRWIAREYNFFLEERGEKRKQRKLDQFQEN